MYVQIKYLSIVLLLFFTLPSYSKSQISEIYPSKSLLATFFDESKVNEEKIVDINETSFFNDLEELAQRVKATKILLSTIGLDNKDRASKVLNSITLNDIVGVSGALELNEVFYKDYVMLHSHAFSVPARADEIQEMIDEVNLEKAQKVQVENNGTLSVSGHGMPLSKVKTIFPDGSVKVSVLDASGNYALINSDLPQPEGNVTTSYEDENGKLLLRSSFFYEDKIKPLPPTINFLLLENNESVKVYGEAEIGSRVLLSLKEESISVLADENGTYFSIFKQKTLLDQGIVVISIDINGNSSDESMNEYKEKIALDSSEKNVSKIVNFPKDVLGVSETVDELNISIKTENNSSKFEDEYTLLWEEDDIEDNETLTFNGIITHLTGSMDKNVHEQNSENFGSSIFKISDFLEDWYFEYSTDFVQTFEALSRTSILQENHTLMSLENRTIENAISITKAQSFVEVSHFGYGDDIGTCTDVSHKAYIRMDSNARLQAGFSLEGIDCDAYKEDNTLSFQQKFSKGTQGLLRATTEEEKERYSQSEVLIEIVTELGDTAIYLGDR